MAKKHDRYRKARVVYETFDESYEGLYQRIERRVTSRELEKVKERNEFVQLVLDKFDYQGKMRQSPERLWEGLFDVHQDKIIRGLSPVERRAAQIEQSVLVTPTKRIDTKTTTYTTFRTGKSKGHVYARSRVTGRFIAKKKW